MIRILELLYSAVCGAEGKCSSYYYSGHCCKYFPFFLVYTLWLFIVSHETRKMRLVLQFIMIPISAQLPCFIYAYFLLIYSHKLLARSPPPKHRKFLAFHAPKII